MLHCPTSADVTILSLPFPRLTSTAERECRKCSRYVDSLFLAPAARARTRRKPLSWLQCGWSSNVWCGSQHSSGDKVCPLRCIKTPRKSCVLVTSDGLTVEEIDSVRERCKRMVAAAATAGATGTWVDARKALLATVFETHPDLGEADLEKYLAIRGLVSATVQRDR